MIGDEGGRAAGGHARAEALSGEELSAIAKRAAAARWDPSLPEASHEGVLVIGELELPVAVLQDGKRLLTSKAFLTALGRPWKGSYKRTQIPSFLDATNLGPFFSPDLMNLINPIEFRNKRGQKVQGFRAELLPVVCDVYLEARAADSLNKRQLPVAARAEMLVRSLSKVGIIALVDEATGYQRDRATDALARILEKFIDTELQPWVKTFPSEFYEHLFRLRGLDFEKDTPKRPQYFGHLTNDIVYKRLAPGVLDELRRLSPRKEDGRLKHQLFRRLTESHGHPKLQQHLTSVTTVMKLSSDYEDFKKKLDRVHPRFGQTLELPFENPPTSGL